MNILFWVQLVMQIFLKKSMESLFSLYFALQMMCYLSYYNVAVPSNAEMYIAEFTKIIEFDVLNPDKLIGKIIGEEDFRTYDYIMGKQELDDSRASHSLLIDMRVIILNSILVILVLLFIFLLKIVSAFRG